MKEQMYEKLSTNMPMGELIDSYLEELSSALNDAKTQGENGSELGMAVAVGTATNVLAHLRSAWNVIKQ